MNEGRNGGVDRLQALDKRPAQVIVADADDHAVIAARQYLGPVRRADGAGIAVVQEVHPVIAAGHGDLGQHLSVAARADDQQLFHRHPRLTPP